MLPSRNEITRKEVGWFVLFVGSLILLISTMDLAHDEAYYWFCSRYPDWSYFDHPPMISWLIALTEGWIDGEWGVRLAPFAFFLAAALWVSRTLIPTERRWAWWAGWLLFPLLSFVPSFAIPDTVLLATALVFIWSLHRYVEVDTYDRALVFGATAVLMLYAKYQGVLLIAGAIVSLPGLLKRRSLWIAALVGGLLFFPHLRWQWQHNASTLAYHLFQAHRAEFSLYRPLEFVLQQVAIPGVLLAPWVWLQAWRVSRSDPFHRALAGMTLITIGVFFLFSFTKKVEGNWTLVAYLALLVLVLRASAEWPLHRRWFRSLGICSLILVLAAKSVVAIPAAKTWVPRLGEIHGWREWAQRLASATPDCELVANRYQIAAKLSFYLKKEILSLNIGSRPNQFDIWRFDKRLRGKPLCWLTNNKDFPATRWFTPDGKRLFLVRGVRLETLLALKKTVD
jgi:hypothetical protein